MSLFYGTTRPHFPPSPGKFTYLYHLLSKFSNVFCLLTRNEPAVLTGKKYLEKKRKDSARPGDLIYSHLVDRKQTFFLASPLVRLSCPSASQVPRRRAVDGYINNQDSNWPIITNNTPRHWSLITGRGGGGGGGYKMGKLRVRNFLRPVSRQGKTFSSGNFLQPPHHYELPL